MKLSSEEQQLLEDFTVLFRDYPPEQKIRALVNYLHSGDLSVSLEPLKTGKGDLNVGETALKRIFGEKGPSLEQRLNSLKPLLETTIEEGIRNARVDGESTSNKESMELIQRLEKEKGNMINQIEKKTTVINAQSKEIKLMRSRILGGALYLLLFAAAIAGSIWILMLVSAPAPKVTVEYNIGEIIAAILAGTGIAAAGIAYAARTFPKKDDE